MPTGLVPESFASTSLARSARSRSVAWSSPEFSSWIQLWMPISWPAAATALISFSFSIAATAGMKKLAGTPWRCSIARMRGMPARAPYCPWLNLE